MHPVKAITFALLACGSFSLPTRNSEVAIPDTDFNLVPMDAPLDDLDFNSIEANAAFANTEFSLIRSRSLVEFRHQLASKTAFDGAMSTPKLSRHVRRATSVQNYDCDLYAEPTTIPYGYTTESSMSPITSMPTSLALPGTTAGIPDSPPSVLPGPVVGEPQTSTIQGVPISSMEPIPIGGTPTPTSAELITTPVPGKPTPSSAEQITTPIPGKPTPSSAELITTPVPGKPTPSSAEQITATLPVTSNTPISVPVPPNTTQPFSASLQPTSTNAVSESLQPTSTMPLSVSVTSGPTTSKPAGEPLQPTNTKPLSMILAVMTSQASSNGLQPTTLS